ncbi:hypothetical protein [Desulfobacterium sp. N47]|uniref:Uncharacterized protein n=1 Tax=uncultured Desulfobacterium sp. TaxID=201089 RepID=E1YGB1_9BACT|nr:hypothetical protein N47_J05860 [uncultured Desulfobacterium sp.]
MDVKDYCSSMEIELVGWKAKIFDAIRKADRLGTAEKGKVFENINDLKIIVADMEEKINRLKTECPSEWSPYKKDMDKGTIDMRSKYEQTMEYIGKASPVSIAG